MDGRVYIQVTVPLKLDWEPWYTADAGIRVGQRVRVTLARREYVGVVHRIGGSGDEIPSKVLAIDGIAEELADIAPEELELWEFIADYYLCTIGEVYKAAYPKIRTLSEISGFKALRKRIPELKPAEKTHPSPDYKPGKPEFHEGEGRFSSYENAIAETSGDTLVLVPDFISLDLMEKRLRPVHPDLMVADSRQTPAKRRRVCEALRYGSGKKIVLGTRSSIFLPFRNLSLVIIDDEQDSNYKQDEPAPRYNGRDCAVMLAKIHGARVITGSSSPSLETVYNCLNGKYEKLNGGIGKADKRNAEIIDTNAESRKNGMRGPFSRRLLGILAENQGPAAIIRGWEPPEELQAFLAETFPERDIRILKYREARETDLSDAVVAVLQADSLVGKDDFRADEKALHIVSELSARCRKLVLQTASPCRFNGSRNLTELLRERRDFGFPPYTRLVETRTGDGRICGRFFLKPDSTLAAKKKEIKENTPKNLILDVDPK